MPSLRRASGCLFGLACGDAEAWPKEWIKRIEYAGRLAMLGSLWDQVL